MSLEPPFEIPQQPSRVTITQGPTGLASRLKNILFNNFEMVLVLVLVGSLFFINYFVVHKYAFLLFYFIPVLLTGFYLSARHAVMTALLSSGFVVYFTLVDTVGTRVTDEGAPYLAEIRSLDDLDLCGTGISDQGLEALGQISRLRRLDLSDTQVTDQGLAHLSGLGGLASLELSNTQVTDAGLVHVKQLSSLLSLDLSNTRVTDAGLAHLANLPELRSLWVSDTAVTAEGVRKFQAGRPNLWIRQASDQ